MRIIDSNAYNYLKFLRDRFPSCLMQSGYKELVDSTNDKTVVDGYLLYLLDKGLIEAKYNASLIRLSDISKNYVDYEFDKTTVRINSAGLDLLASLGI